MSKEAADNVAFAPQDYDAQTIAVMEQILRKDSNCVDVGCHAGDFMDVILRLSPDGAHFGFEPLPDLHRRLKDKYAGFPRVDIHGCALSDSAGQTSFQHVTTNKAYSGIKKRRYDRPNETVEEIHVTMARLDDLVPKDLPIHFIKIDVEGAELQVLKGAISTIRNYKPTIVFEHGLGAADCYGTTPEDIYDLLTTQGGLCVSLMTGWLSGGEPLTRTQFAEEFNSARNYYFMAHRAAGVR